MMFNMDVSRMESIVFIPDSVYKAISENTFNTFFIFEYLGSFENEILPEKFTILTCGNCGEYFPDPEDIKGRLAIEKIPNFASTKKYYDGIVDALKYNKSTLLENYHWKNMYIDEMITLKIYPIDVNIVGVTVKNSIEILDARKKAKDAIDLKNLFTANMSHEIRTPLSAIIGLTKLLEVTDLSPTQKQYLRYMNQSCNALMAIINDILDYAKLDGGRVSLHDTDFILKTLISETCNMVEGEAKSKNITITKTISTNVPHCCVGDSNRISQIILNLLSNSIKFTGENGMIEIIVKLDQVNMDETLKLHFAVKDNGIGISKEDQIKLFQPYSQIDNTNTKKYKGAGLGLLISKKLVNLMGGEIWVDSDLNKGSTFGFYIIVKGCKNSNNLVAGELMKYAYNKHVLIVDDDPINRLQLIKIVKMWGMIPSVASSVIEAEMLLEDSNFDLGLIDMIMPEKNGSELAEIIRNKKYEFPIIALSSLDEIDYPPETKFTSTLNKPINREKLENVVLNILAYESNKPTFLKIKTKLKILSAEDHQSNQLIICQYLKNMGVEEIDTAANGKEAIQKALKCKYDLIFMDIKMPVMDGLTASKIIKSNYSLSKHKCFMVALTAQAMEDDCEKYKNEGFDGYISKPIILDHLKNIMQEVIEASE